MLTYVTDKVSGAWGTRNFNDDAQKRKTKISSSVVAYTFRYFHPLKRHLLASSCSPSRHNRRSLSPATSAAIATSGVSSCRLLDKCFCTGSSSFRRMQQVWSGNSINKNKGMVGHLQQYGVIQSKKVSEVMETVDRGLFVPAGSPAYVDSPMQIGFNATISAPHMHATCLELLEDNLQPGMRALDVGSGTGYLTACFALMVGPQGRVIGVEHIPELVQTSIKNVEKSAAAPLLKDGSLALHEGDGRKGWPEFAPYDAIHVGAAAPEIPQPLIDQLKPGGRLVIPVGKISQDLKVIDKNENGSVSIRSETSVRYVPLTSREAQLRGH